MNVETVLAPYYLQFFLGASRPIPMFYKCEPDVELGACLYSRQMEEDFLCLYEIPDVLQMDLQVDGEIQHKVIPFFFAVSSLYLIFYSCR